MKLFLRGNLHYGLGECDTGFFLPCNMCVKLLLYSGISILYICCANLVHSIYSSSFPQIFLFWARVVIAYILFLAKLR